MANQPEDIVGTWNSQGSFQLIITDSGGVRIKDVETGEEMVGVGAFGFDGEQLVIDSEVCLKWEGGFAIEFACQGVYTVYLLKEVETVVGLRFEEIEDPYRDRRQAMTEDTWQRVED